jgi:hypothetical protein
MTFDLQVENLTGKSASTLIKLGMLSLPERRVRGDRRRASCELTSNSTASTQL